jgi:hypothetical protein
MKWWIESARRTVEGDFTMNIQTPPKLAFAFVLFVALTSFSIPPADASGWHGHDDGEACFPLLGNLRVTFVAQGCTSPVGMCTTGVYRSAFVSGTTSFRATGIGGLPVGETSIVTPPAEPNTTWSYSGELTITTRVGTLVFADVGVLDTVAGTFTELNRPVSGTGTFEGMTGRAFVSGTVTEDGNGFDGTVTGRICVPTE